MLTSVDLPEGKVTWVRVFNDMPEDNLTMVRCARDTNRDVLIRLALAWPRASRIPFLRWHSFGQPVANTAGTLLRL
jgi:hypothetical protein